MQVSNSVNVMTYDPDNIGGELLIVVNRFIRDENAELHIINGAEFRITIEEAQRLVNRINEAIASL